MILHLGLPYWWSNIGGRPLDHDMMEIHKPHQVQPDMDSLGLERPEHRPPNWRPCFSGMVGLYNVIYFRSVRSHRSIGWRCENLVGGLEHVILFHVLGIIIPTDLHIFQRGRAQPPTSNDSHESFVIFWDAITFVKQKHPATRSWP